MVNMEGGSRMKLLYGTGNPAKISSMRKKLSGLDIEMIGLRDLNLEIPEIVEDGTSPLENAVKKAHGYYEVFKMPVFSCDTGLYFEELPEELQPGIHVRNVKGKRLSEMITYYTGLVKEYGNLHGRYWNAICFILDREHQYAAMDETLASARFLLTSQPHKVVKEGFPLDSLSIDLDSGQYFYDVKQKDVDQGSTQGFLEFFKNVLKLN